MGKCAVISEKNHLMSILIPQRPAQCNEKSRNDRLAQEMVELAALFRYNEENAKKKVTTMANEKIQRPDAGMVRSMIDSASRIDGKLQQVHLSEEAHRRAAQQAALQLYNDRIRKALEQMDVEHINNGKQGIRVGLLRSHGVENVWQVSRMSYREICDIDGLGEQSAMKIRDIVRQIEENTKATIRIRIRVENPSQEDDDLIRSLYIRIHAKPLRQRCSALYQANHHGLQQEFWRKKDSAVLAGCLSLRRKKSRSLALRRACGADSPANLATVSCWDHGRLWRMCLSTPAGGIFGSILPPITRNWRLWV